MALSYRKVIITLLPQLSNCGLFTIPLSNCGLIEYLKRLFFSSGSNLLVSDSHRFGKDGPGHNFRAGRCGQAPVVPPEGAKILR